MRGSSTMHAKSTKWSEPMQVTINRKKERFGKKKKLLRRKWQMAGGGRILREHERFKPGWKWPLWTPWKTGPKTRARHDKKRQLWYNSSATHRRRSGEERGNVGKAASLRKVGRRVDTITDTANIRHNLNKHGQQEEVGCHPETLPHLGLPWTYHGWRQGGATYHNSTRALSPSFAHPSPNPPHLSFAQRACTQAPMFEPLLQALDTRNGRAHITRAKRR